MGKILSPISFIIAVIIILFMVLNYLSFHYIFLSMPLDILIMLGLAFIFFMLSHRAAE